MKSKRFITILLSLAIMLTFMPAMAFAANGNYVGPDPTKVEWNSDYTKVTVPAYKGDRSSDGVQVPKHTYDTVRYYDNSNGTVVAMIDPNSSVSWTIPFEVKARYYDLSVAEFADSSNKTLKSEYANGSYTPESMTKVKLNVPSYVINATQDTVYPWGEGTLYKGVAQYGKLAGVEGIMYPDWTGVAVGDDEIDKTKRTEQTFTLSLEGEYDSEYTPSYLKTKLYGTIAAKEVKINAADPDPAEDAKYFFDSEEAGTIGDGTSAKPFQVLYDGSAHTFKAETTGWTASFSIYDSTTGNYNRVLAVNLTDIQLDKNNQPKPLQVKVEWTKDGETTPAAGKTKVVYVNLKQAGVAMVGFNVEPEADTYYHVAGSEYNATDYIDAVADVIYDKTETSAEKKKIAKLVDTATAKAVAANKSELLSYLADYYDVKATVHPYNPNIVELEFDSKDLTPVEQEALAAKYAGLNAKFRLIDIEKDEARVALNGIDPTDFEIEFTTAPAKKTFSGKKTTKAGKLKKNQSFTVKAETKNGTVLKYKLINAPKKNITINAKTGKITVKKGTPKGTYTFKVKAYITKGVVREFDGHGSYSETQTIKVVVKK